MVEYWLTKSEEGARTREVTASAFELLLLLVLLLLGKSVREYRVYLLSSSPLLPM